MKKILFILLAAAFMSSCGGSNYTVSGKLEVTPGDSLYLLSADRDRAVLGSAVLAKDSTFRIKGYTQEPVIALLTDKSRQPITMLFIEPGQIALGTAQNGYMASGTTANDNFNALNKKMGELQTEFYSLGPEATAEQQEALQEKFNNTLSDAVSNNLDNIFGVYVFTNAEFNNMEPADAKARIAEFTPEMQNHKLMKKAQESIAAIENTEVGKPYMELSLQNAEGQPIALSSLVGPGKWVLLDFWATWCGPCVGEIPHLTEAYAKYKDKGFEIYGVSLDNDEARWKNFLSSHDMSWTNVIAIEADKSSPAAEQYGIRTIPANFLISPDGVIVAKDLRGEALQEKLAEVIK